MPPRFKRNFQCILLRILIHLSHYSYGTITLYGTAFQQTLDHTTKAKNKSCNTTSLNHFWQDSVCPVLCSVALTNSISIDFFSSRYCNALLPWVRRPCGLSKKDKKSHSGIHGSKAACASPWHFVACHALLRRSSQVIHLIV